MKYELSDKAIKALSLIVPNISIKPGEPDFLDIAAGLNELAELVRANTSSTPNAN